MISYPIYENNTCFFEGIKFVRNMGPNFNDDGLIGWIQFDEKDTNTLNYVVHEITQCTRKWKNQNEYEEEYDKVMRYVLQYKNVP